MSTSAVDLHVHSTASDGELAPAAVAQRARTAGLTAFALTDHDTVDGVREAAAAAATLGVRVIAGCEFSVKAPWGEMHLLGYFLPVGHGRLERFLEEQREQRLARMTEIVRRLNGGGIAVTLEEIQVVAGGGAVGRPHAARALVARGEVRTVGEAFDRYLRRGRPAFVPKALPAARDVMALIRAVGGVSSAAHLKDRAGREGLRALRDLGLDGVEARHPSHDAATSARIERLAGELDLLPTGGSDWHGDGRRLDPDRAALGSVVVPPGWLAAVERLHEKRHSAEVIQ